MPLDPLQLRIAAILKKRRSKNSFVGGSSVFNEHFPRRSDDIDIYVEDKPFHEIAEADLTALRAAGLSIIDHQQHYGFSVDAAVADAHGKTQLEWVEADRSRFYPIQPHPTFGWALHKCDLAIQKLVAGASRRKARDMVDLFLIDQRYLPLAVLAIAAPAKLPGASPIAILERARQIGMGHPIDEFESLRLDPDDNLPPLGEIKFRFADQIERAINDITDRCWDAEPGHIYVDQATRLPALPTTEAMASLKKHAATERGALPFVPQKPGRSGWDMGR